MRHIRYHAPFARCGGMAMKLSIIVRIWRIAQFDAFPYTGTSMEVFSLVRRCWLDTIHIHSYLVVLLNIS